MQYPDNILTVVTFGDSTTARRDSIDKVYTDRLEDMLTRSGTAARVINEGIPGSHTGSIKDNNVHEVLHGMDRFGKSVLHYQPDWVIICFGINDSWQYNGSIDPSAIHVRQYSRNLLYFIDGIQKNNGKVILMTPNPLGGKYEEWRHQKLNTYSEVTKRLAIEKNTFLVDTWSLFNEYVKNKGCDIDVLLLDGMHPNDNGHRIMAETLANIIIGSK